MITALIFGVFLSS